MDTVGIRDLKARLSHHLQRVRDGATLVVTDRGREIATIAPVQARAGTEWAWKMVQEGRAHWNGGKPVGCNPRVRLKGGATVSDAVIEDRG